MAKEGGAGTERVQLKRSGETTNSHRKFLQGKQPLLFKKNCSRLWLVHPKNNARARTSFCVRKKNGENLHIVKTSCR